MPQSFITATSASAQTFTVPSAYVDATATIEVIAPGGNGAAGTTGATGNGGGGGAGGGYAKSGQTVALGLIAGETIYYTQQAANSNVDSWFNPTNLFLQSAFASGWTILDTTLTTGISDPFGGANAANLIPDNVNTFHLVSQVVTPAAAFIPFTFSVYAKANGYNFLEMQATRQDGAASVSAWFDLSSGTISTAVALAGSGYSTPFAGIVPVIGASGWYRCWMSATDDGDPPILCRLFPCSTNGSNTFAGNTTSGITVYGPQVNMRNNIPGAFMATTTVSVYAALAKAGSAGSTTTGGTAPTTGGQGDLVRNGGNGGNSGITRGGGGGGGAAGFSGNGAVGGAAGALDGGGGGGGSNNGSAGAASTLATGGNGGNGGGGSGGGTGGATTGGAATASSGGGGGGGGLSATVGANTTGGAGAGDLSLDATHGAGGGGGGGGGDSALTGAPTTNGGAGGNYGAGGGGAGFIRNAGTQAGGAGVQGVMALTYPDQLMGQVVM